MERIKIRDFSEYKYISCLRLSSDKVHAGFVVTCANCEKNKYLSNIWIYDLSTDKYKQITFSDNETQFRWLNEDNIIFPAVRDDSVKQKLSNGEDWTVYYKLNTNAGEAEEYFRVPIRASSIEVIDENNFLIKEVFNGGNKRINDLSEDEKEKAIEQYIENKDYKVLDEIPFWENGRSFTNKCRYRLYMYNSLSKELKTITSELTEVDMFRLSGCKVLYSARTFKDKRGLTFGLYLYDINSDTTETIIPDERYRIHNAQIIDHRIFVAATDMKEYGMTQIPQFFVIDNKQMRLLYDNDFGLGDYIATDIRLTKEGTIKVHNGEIYFVSTESRSSFIKKISLEGEVKKLTGDVGAIDGFEIIDDEIIFIGLKNQKLQEIYKLKNGEETQLTQFNENVQSEKNITKPERLNCTSDGNIIEGYVLKPINYEVGKKYPAILEIHGGPKTVFGEVFFHEMQYLSSLGYFVFYCNPRGSHGRGNEFADMRCKYGTVDYDDLMKFTDEVLKNYPEIDLQRIGVVGGSYGGFMTNWIIGHTNRFKCAVSQRSISNWISNAGTSDMGYYYVKDQNGYSVWEDVEKLWWHSPLKYADKVKTPTLFIHSDEDYRCCLSEGLQMFTALKYHGIDSRLFLFNGENHELSRSGKPKHRVKRLQEITDWLEKYLK